MNDPTPSTEKARSVWKPQGSQEDWRPETHTLRWISSLLVWTASPFTSRHQ